MPQSLPFTWIRSGTGARRRSIRTRSGFLERTFLTKGLTGVAAEVLRRLSGEKTETSAVFNMTTQFGGGKTHALTLLYHLANNGPKAKDWQGVSRLLQVAGLNAVPAARVAAFVGTEFDPIAGRGGADGTPNRKTPWGEIAFQLGGASALAVLAEHEKQVVAPGGDVIRAFLPKDRPVLILMDELMNFVSRSRKSGMAGQLYSFLHNLSEEARGRDNMVLAVSIPASELEMSADDQSDYERFKKLLDRVGKAVIMSAESETSEIIRRRLFEWDENAVASDGRVLLNRDAIGTCNEFGDWVKDHKQQVPEQFPFRCARARRLRRPILFIPAFSRSSRESGRACRDSSKPAEFSGCWPCGSPMHFRTDSRATIAIR